MFTLLLPLVALPARVEGPVQFVTEARAACHAAAHARPVLEGVTVEEVPAEPGDLPKLRITDERSGGWMLAFYDAASASAAMSRAACLGAQLRLLSTYIGHVPPRTQWHSVVFTTSSHYVAPAGQTAARWRITMASDGTLGADGERMVVLIMPHEQVHRFQGLSGTKLPRWFEEGEAEWISRKVKRALAPAEAAESVAGYATALAQSDTPTSLAAWGGMRVTRAAIMRQLPPEERRRMEADPNYSPNTSNISFHFGPGDLESDESNTQARYEAATLVFDELEANRGFELTRDWANGITSRRGAVSTKIIEEDAAARLHFDLAGRLAATERPHANGSGAAAP